MFFAIPFALTLSLAVSAIVVPRSNPPAGWDNAALEPYSTYHSRYIALGCENKHAQPFFNLCCHPLLATEKLASRPAQCTPTSSPSSAPAPTSTASDDDDCNGESTVPPAVPSTTTPSFTPTATIKASTHSTPSPSSAVQVGSSSTTDIQLNTGGFATFFFQNGVAGACGTVHSDNALIAAIDADRYGNLGLVSPLCGKQVKITNPANHQSVTVTIADACPTCKNGNSIDLSVAAFKKLATLDQGMVGITWSFL